MKAATLKNWRPITWQCKVKHHASLLCGRGSYLDGCDLKTWTTLLRCGNGKKRWQIGKFYRISGFLKKDLAFFEQDTRTGYKSNLEKDIKGYVHVFVCILNKKKSNSVYTMLCMYEFHQFNVILLPNSCMKDHLLRVLCNANQNTMQCKMKMILLSKYCACKYCTLSSETVCFRPIFHDEYDYNPSSPSEMMKLHLMMVVVSQRNALHSRNSCICWCFSSSTKGSITVQGTGAVVFTLLSYYTKMLLVLQSELFKTVKKNMCVIKWGKTKRCHFLGLELHVVLL